MNSKFHESFYSYAKYYDIAFGFKDVPRECLFLKEIFLKHSGRALQSFIEFGAGPALHCLEMAKAMRNVRAIDLSEEMVDYALKKALESDLSIQVECANMVSYQTNERFDMATLLMDSSAYLLTNDQMIQHLRSVANTLNADGLYILEMSHPKSVFDLSRTTLSEWEMERDSVKVKVQWGGEGDSFDPITQLTEVSVRLEYEDHGKSGVIEDKSLQRCFSATEFDALVKASGVFQIVEYFGGMDSNLPFNNDKQSWRMVPVLKKL